MIGPILRAIADRIDPPKPDPRARDPLPTRRLFDDDGLADRRRVHALELLDDETCGYVLVKLRDEHGYMRLVPQIALPPEAWPAMRQTLASIVDESMRVLG